MANLFQPSLIRALDLNGDPVSGAKMYFYQTETTTLQSVYTDPDGLIAATNPLVADGQGRFEPVFLDTSKTYRVKAVTSDESDTLFDVDPVTVSSVTSLVTNSKWNANDVSSEMVVKSVATTVSGNTFTATNHGLRMGDVLYVRADINGLTANEKLYVTNARTDTFEVAATLADAYRIQSNIFDGNEIVLNNTLPTTFYLLADPGQVFFRTLSGDDLGGVDGAFEPLGETVRVCPELFGWTGTDDAADWEALVHMAAWGRAQGQLHIVTKNGQVYKHLNAQFLANIEILKIEGGGIFQSRLGSANGGILVQNVGNHSGLAFPTPFNSSGHGPLIGSGLPDDQGTRIATVAADTKSIVTEDSSNWTGIEADSYVLIYGFDRQNTASNPPNCSVFEYAVVESVSGSTITLRDGVKNSYDEDWPDTGIFGSSGNYGAPRLVALNRPDFKIALNKDFTDLKAQPDSGWTDAYATDDRNGRLSIFSAIDLRIKGLETPAGVYFSCLKNGEIEGLRIDGYLETDKLIESIIYRDGQAGTHGQGGAIEMTFENFDVLDSFSMGAIRKCSIIGGRQPGTGAGSSTALVGIDTNCPILEVKNRLFEVEDSGRVGILGRPTNKSGSFTIVSDSLIRIASSTYSSTQFSDYIYINQPFFTSDGNVAGYVTDLPVVNGSNIDIGAKLVQDLSSPSTIYFGQVAEIILENNSFIGTYGDQILDSESFAATDPQHWAIHSARRGDNYVKVKSEDLTADLTQKFINPGHLFVPEKLVVHVSKAYSGSGTGNHDLLLKVYLGYTFAEIDLKTTGTRVLDFSGNYGSAGADVLTGVASGAFRTLQVQGNPAETITDSHDAAIWDATFFGQRIGPQKL